MKTSHQLARELLAGPDLPIWHFDPSRAGLDYTDSSLSEPEITHDDTRLVFTEDEVEEMREGGAYMGPFITISGEQDLSGEVMTDTERDRLHALKELDARVHSNYDFNADPDDITLLVGAAIRGEPRPLSKEEKKVVEAAWQRFRKALNLP